MARAKSAVLSPTDKKNALKTLKAELNTVNNAIKAVEKKQVAAQKAFDKAEVAAKKELDKLIKVAQKLQDKFDALSA